MKKLRNHVKRFKCSRNAETVFKDVLSLRLCETETHVHFLFALPFKVKVLLKKTFY